MQPVDVRKNKHMHLKSKPSSMIDFKNNKGGGEVKMVTNPESATGSTGKNCSHPHVESGNEEAIQKEMNKSK